MARDSLLIEDQPGETRIARMLDGRLHELIYVHDHAASLVGGIYLGRVRRVEPGLEAAFVDLGLPQAGFLAVEEARPTGARGGKIADHVKEGDAVLVQIMQDALADKGPKLTTRLSFQGRLVVLMPGQRDLRASGRVGGGERQRLLDILEGPSQVDEGWIARTAAGGRQADDIAGEVARLRQAWQTVKEAADAGNAPACLLGEREPVLRILRDLDAADVEILIEGADMLRRVREFCNEEAPDLSGRVAAHAAREPLFEAHAVDEQIEEALSPTVGLAGGGAVTFQETRAVIAIDIDSARAPSRGGREAMALAVNSEAVAEIARQMRLRGLAGLIVIDPLRLRSAENRKNLPTRLRAEVASDPAKVEVAGYTKLGLIEMTRRRGARSLERGLSVGCAACAGQGRVRAPRLVAFEALRHLRREALATPGPAFVLHAPRAVIETLRGDGASALRRAEQKMGSRVTLSVDDALPADIFRIDPGP